jgi:protease YdgD
METGMKLSIRGRSSGFPSGPRASANVLSGGTLIRGALVALIIPLIAAGAAKAEVATTGLITASFSTAASSALRQLPGGNAVHSDDWNTVGRLKLGDRGFCTAVLISPKEILTSAHCLYNKKSGARLDPTKLVFQASWQNGAVFAERGISLGVVHPAYKFSKSNQLANIAHDLALLDLAQPIELSPMRQSSAQFAEPHRSAFKEQGLRNFLPANAVAAGDKVGVASYAYNRAQRLSVQKSCPVLAHKQGVMVTSCSIDSGSSGAPVFVRGEGDTISGLVAIIAAKAKLNGKPIALATPIEPNLPGLRDEMAKERNRNMLSLFIPAMAQSARG